MLQEHWNELVKTKKVTKILKKLNIHFPNLQIQLNLNLYYALHSLQK